MRGVVQGCPELKAHKGPICLLPSPSTKGASVFGRHASQLGSLNLLHPVCVSLASGGTGCHCAPRSRIITAVCRSPRQAGESRWRAVCHAGTGKDSTRSPCGRLRQKKALMKRVFCKIQCTSCCLPSMCHWPFGEPLANEERLLVMSQRALMPCQRCEPVKDLFFFFRSVSKLSGRNKSPSRTGKEGI